MEHIDLTKMDKSEIKVGDRTVAEIEAERKAKEAADAPEGGTDPTGTDPEGTGSKESDPAGSEPKGTEPEGGEPEGGEKPTGTTPEITSEDIDKFLERKTEGKVKSLDSLISQTQKNPYKDEFIAAAVNHYNETGDLSKFVELQSKNYKEMDAENLLREDLREQYSDLSAENFERLYAREVTQKYGLDPDKNTEDEIELGRELLKRDAEKVRSQKVEAQEKLLATKPTEKTAEEIQKKQDAERKLVMDNPVTKSLTENQRLEIKDGEKVLNFGVEDPNTLINATLDESNFYQMFAGENGQFDLDKWYKVVAYASNPEEFEKALIGHGRSVGTDETVRSSGQETGDKGGNPSTQVREGDKKAQLMQAFKKQGKHTG